VNLPAHLVIIKGTEFFDAPSKRYVDFPITDVLQVIRSTDKTVRSTDKTVKARFRPLLEPFSVQACLKPFTLYPSDREGHRVLRRPEQALRRFPHH